jgi:hypothetical protein
MESGANFLRGSIYMGGFCNEGLEGIYCCSFEKLKMKDLEPRFPSKIIAGSPYFITNPYKS